MGDRFYFFIFYFLCLFFIFYVYFCVSCFRLFVSMFIYMFLVYLWFPVLVCLRVWGVLGIMCSRCRYLGYDIRLLLVHVF